MSPELQATFMHALTGVESERDINQLLSYINDVDGLSIYRDSMQASLCRALVETYPVCQILLGESMFRQLALDYIEQYPSRDYDLCLYGEDFPAYLSHQHSLNEHPYLGDLALFEWYLMQCFYAQDDGAGNLNQLTDLNEYDLKNVRFSLLPNLVLLESNYPVDLLWLYNRHGDIDDADLKSLEQVFNERDKTRVAIYRFGGEVKYFSLDYPMAYLISLINKKLNFSQINVNFSRAKLENEFWDCLEASIQKGLVHRFV